MRNVPIAELRPGDIIAQHILSEDDSILLASGSVLSAKSIELLANWQIHLVRLREEQDSDEDVNLALQFDAIIRPFQDLPDTAQTVAVAERPVVPPPPSIINQKSLQQYDSIFSKTLAIVSDRHLYTNLATLDSMAHIIQRFATQTPGAIGYTLKEMPSDKPLAHLTRHSLAVAVIATKLASLLDCPNEQLERITLGALLHDIGKLLLPPELREKNTDRSNDEEALYRSHVQSGHDIFLRKPLANEVFSILLQHHERIDGSGFPRQLSGSAIHLCAQIVALADRFDHLLHDSGDLPDLFTIRSRLLADTAGKLLSDVIDTFDRYLATFTYSVNVELSDGRAAEVLYTHSAFRFPVVKTDNGELLDLNKQPDIRIKRLKV